MENRKQHEKEYHNKRFVSNIREKESRNYIIVGSIKEKYTQFLESLCCNKRVLEIGCAGGGRISRLSELGNQVTGIDISEAALEQAARTADSRQLKKIDLQVMDAENMTFPDNTFDVVYGNSILHHLEINRIYQELVRILKPGGTALFIEPLGHNFLINLYRRMTPGSRTETEHPLHSKDLKLAKRYFEDISKKYFYLFAIAAIPFANTPVFPILLKIFEGIDRILFSLIPFTRRYAWMVLFIMAAPKK